MDFYTAWNWLVRHPAFAYKGTLGLKYPSSGFAEALDIMVARIDPVTRRIEDDTSRNTHTEIWLECGPYIDADQKGIDSGFYGEQWINYGIPGHDVYLDCGGDTFELAVINLSELVKKHYGDYAESDGVD